MNKQELIEKYKSALNKVHKVYGDYYKTEAYEEVLKDLKQLDEPQKVIVPQFVADWIEKNRGSLFGLNYDSVSSEIYDWVYEEEGNLKKLHLACAIGYEVEKEPKYTVKIKSVNQYLVRNTDEDFLGFLQSRLKSKFTRKELEEAGLSDVFNSPLFEVEEVE